MSYPLHTYAIVCYIEAHIREEKPNQEELAQMTGYSYAHIRDFFKRDTGYSLAHYIRMRKVCISAFELLHTHKTIVEIALEYGFSSHESYTRAFTKILGMTPSAFRNSKSLMGKSELAPGIYGIGLLRQKEKRSDVSMKEKYQNNQSTILYGVPKVEWGSYGGCTPYPICLKACADYLGDDLDYAAALVSCGAAFRFTWNATEWDMCNVDIYHTFDEGGEETVYSYAAKALGREFSMLDRTEATTKEEFVQFIRQHIDEGYPCIAQGIIGPPEACIITGYRDNGNTLLGWNFFQHDPAFGGSVRFDECGYFICDNWWENTDTQSVMCLGPVISEPFTTEEIIRTAIRVMTPRTDGGYCKGIAGFSVWADMLSDESAFPTDGTDALLFEKMLCQDDAMTSIRDGRGCAAEYFKKLEMTELAGLFTKEKFLAENMWALFDTCDESAPRHEKLADKVVREKACGYIRQIEVLERQSLSLLQKLVLN